MAKSRSRGKFFASLLLLLLLLLFFVWVLWQTGKQPVRQEVVSKAKIEKKITLRLLLSQGEVKKFFFKSVDTFPYRHLIIEIKKRNIPEFVKKVEDFLRIKKIGFQGLRIYNTYYFRLSKVVEKTDALVVRPYYDKPTLSLVIDDVGNKWHLLKKFADLNYKISFAVFPFEVFSRRSSRFLGEQNYLVLLHLPMEPIRYKENRMIKGMLKVNMGPAEMRKVLKKSLDNLFYIKGINNHVGSKFTSDRDAMEKFASVVKKLHLFFLDSMTSGKSVGWKVAFENGIPTAKRNVFIDNSLDSGKIKKMWLRAVEIARKRGKVIVIGHLHPQTVKEVLNEYPLLRVKGVIPVFVSDLLF